jgi:hypothetical protein
LLNTTLTPHSIIHGNACFAYFNKIWGIPRSPSAMARMQDIEVAQISQDNFTTC